MAVVPAKEPGRKPGQWGHNRPGQSGGPRPAGGNRFGAGAGTGAGQGGGFQNNSNTSGNGPARGGGRGRGGAAGAFGRQGGKSSKARKNRLAKRQEFQEMKAPVIGGVRIPTGNGQTVRLRQGASLADLAEKINVNPAALVTVLFHLGEMATATQSLDESTFQILGEEIGWNIQIVSAEEEDKELLQQFDIDLDSEELQEDEDLKPRPPVVTVMGHVDHGKTRLLDTIRKTNVIAREAGGITQRIGAYQVTVDLEGEKRKITFLDTPGHEAFTAMRARGAELTDVAILVVAADDGVMPQTVEAINHAQAAKVPIVVAVNKIDKPGANPEKVRGQLTEFGLVPEEYGGDTMFVDISAKQGTNVDKLLEAVLLTADADLDLRANPDMDARGATVEARLDKGRGAVATVLVQQGTLRIGDAIVAGTSYGRVRAMLDENGNHMKEATPSTPVQVLGLTSVPTAGDLFLVASDDRTARQIAEKRQATERAAQLAKRRKIVSLESLKEQFAKSEVDMLNIVIKGDSSGSVEALEDSLMKIEVSDEVGIQVIHRGVGAITQNDVNLATVDKAVIIGFNVRPNRQVADLADREGVEIKYYSIIYKAIEDIEAPSRACSSRNTKRSSPPTPRSARSSAPPSSATSPALWCRTARSSAVRSAVSCATASPRSTTWKYPRCVASRTTCSPSRKATRPVSTSALSTTSSSATSSRPSRCRKSSASRRIYSWGRALRGPPRGGAANHHTRNSIRCMTGTPTADIRLFGHSRDLERGAELT